MIGWAAFLESEMTDDEILEIAGTVYRTHSINVKPGYVRQARIDFARHIEAVTIERAAKACEERGERNRLSAGLPGGDRDEFYCADDIRRLIGETKC